MRRALELAEQLGETRAKASVLGWAAFRLLAVEADRERALALAEEGIRIARTLGLREHEANALNSLGTARVVTGDIDGGVAALEEALELARRVSTVQTIRATGNLASVVTCHGDLARGRQLHEEGLDLSRQLGLGLGIRWLRGELAIDRYFAGEWAEAARELDVFVAEAEDSPYFMGPVARATRALLGLARGDVEGSLLDSELALEHARAAVEKQVVCPALGVRARVLLEAEQREEAARVAAELSAVAPTPMDVLPHSWFLDLGIVLRSLGRSDDVLELIERLDARTRWVEATMLLARGDLVGSADLLAEIGSLPDEAYGRLLAAERLIEEGRRAEADEQLRRALGFWRSVGATRYVLEGEALLAATG
jgi:tetratricopeptide (TPR) repeat protein